MLEKIVSFVLSIVCFSAIVLMIGCGGAQRREFYPAPQPELPVITQTDSSPSHSI